MGAGLALQIKQAYPKVFSQYKSKCNLARCAEELLGTIDICVMDFLPVVVNLYAQVSFGRTGIYTNYDALRGCLIQLRDWITKHQKHKTVLGFPYGLGCGLAGGDWAVVYDMIKAIFEHLDNIDVEIWRL